MHDNYAEISWDGLDDHVQALHAYLARRCRDVNQADDVAQEALMRAARFRSRLLDVRNLRGWILRIGSSVLRDQLRRERRQQRIDGADELLARHAGREPEPGQWGEDELFYLDGQIVERTELMSEVDLALAEVDEQDRRVLASVYGADLCRETPEETVESPISPVRRKERLFRARQRLYRRLSARVHCVVRCGDEFASARLARPCTGGGALARLPGNPEPGAESAQRESR